MTPEGVIPMGKKFMAEIERLQNKKNLKKEDIEALVKEIHHRVYCYKENVPLLKWGEEIHKP
jgi:hypothetical protein